MKRHFVALDAWRGICATLVATHHLVQFSVNQYHHALIGSFFLFVDFFFVLSGFVISYNYYAAVRNNVDYKIYLIRRIGRVWPAHAFVMVLFLVFIGLLLVLKEQNPYTIGASPTTYDWRKFPLVLLLTNSLGLYSGGWNLPSWSIGAEMCAYILFGLAFLGRHRLLMAAILTGIGFIVVFAVGNGDIGLTANLGAFRCVWGFGVGVIIFRVWSAAQKSTRASTVLSSTISEVIALAFILLFLWASMNPDGTANGISLAAPVVFGVAVLVFAFDGGVFSSILASAPTRYIGKLSYSIYINHWLIFLASASIFNAITPSFVEATMWGGKYLVWDLQNPTRFWSILSIYLGLTITISHFTFVHIEERGRRFTAQLVRRAFGSAN